MEIQRLHEPLYGSGICCSVQGRGMKPKTVEITTTATVHTIVLCNTSLKVEPLRTLVKVVKSAEALDKAGLTYLTHRSTENFKDRKEYEDCHKKDAGKQPQIWLHSSQRFLFFHIYTTKSIVKKNREPVTNVRLPVKSYL